MSKELTEAVKLFISQPLNFPLSRGQIMEVARVALPILEQQELGYGDWIEWGGGKQPIADGREVAIKLRDGKVMTETLSDCWVWSHGGDYDDIIAYRIIPEQPTNQNGEH